MSYTTGRNSFTSLYLWNINLLQTLQVIYSKCRGKTHQCTLQLVGGRGVLLDCTVYNTVR